MTSINPEHLNLFKSLFKAREDVFAIRWEKNGKSNYTPAFSYDPHRYRIHQAKGGTFQTFTDKPLTDQELINHLAGRQVVEGRQLFSRPIHPILAGLFTIILTFRKGSLSGKINWKQSYSNHLN